MLKMAVAVCVDPIAMVVRRMLAPTTDQTALRGVFVAGLILERVLFLRGLG